MNTCSSCRHWRPIRGSLTGMVCSLIRNDSQHPAPAIVLDLMRQKPVDYPMILATPAGFGCSLHEDQPPYPDRCQDRAPSAPGPRTAHSPRPPAAMAHRASRQAGT